MFNFSLITYSYSAVCPCLQVDDCGGGYSESIAEICEELQNGSVNILCATPNGRSESGANRDCFLLNPLCATKLHQNMFKLLGMLIGMFNAYTPCTTCTHS